MEPEGTYQIEYATANVEAIMAISQAAMEILLDGPDGRHSHIARAVQLILDDQVDPLQLRIQQLEEQVLKHHPDPYNRQVPESQPMFVERIRALTARYEHHMKSRFPKKLKHTEDSVFYTFTIVPIVINRALRHLNAEIITREPSDPIRLGYTSALRELAADIPQQRSVLTMCREKGEGNNDRKRRFLKQAEDALQDTDELTALYPPGTTDQEPPLTL